MLFATDEELRQLQTQAGRLKRGETLDPSTARREAIDDARELRAHQRSREFAWLLFVLPGLIAIAGAFAGFVMSRILR